ncbi:MAG: phage protease [Deltaproteobacteria bacterium]
MNHIGNHLIALARVDTAPDWVMLFPLGHMKARDGREFDLADPKSVVTGFDQGAVDLPVDYEHQNDRDEPKRSGPVPAAGWIKELEVRSDGPLGRVEWTATAREMIARKEYRYISPSFWHAPDGTVTKLKGAGLVHNPALHLKALASEVQTMPKNTDIQGTLLTRLAELLALDPASTEDAVLAELAKRLAATDPDPAKYVPTSAVAAMLQDRASETAQVRTDRVQHKIASAIAEGRITPGMRPWALELCRSNEASFDAFVRDCPAIYAHLLQPMQFTQSPASRETVAASGTEAAVCAQLGLKPGTLLSQG